MEIILKNLPETNEEVYLIIEQSLLNNNNQIIYDINEINEENKNQIIISQNKYKYTKIFTNIEKDFISNMIINNINTKNDINLLIAINKSQNESENNINIKKSVVDELNNLFNKGFFEQNKIKQIIYNYHEINLELNNNDNNIKNKYINKDSESFTIDILSNSEEKNIRDISDLFLLNIQFDYLNDDIINIPSFINIYFIYNSFEKILPLFSINKKEKEILVLKEKINNLLSLEKDLKDNINKLPVMNDDFIQNINIYKNEVMNYFDNFIKGINIDKKANKTKNNLNDLIKGAKNLLECLNKEQFKIKEKEIYQKYIEIYSNNKNNNNSFDIQELKSSINKFNNLNEELLEFLEKEKSKEKYKSKKDKEISELKQRIKQLEKEKIKESKQETDTPQQIQKIKNQTKNNKKQQRSISASKINNNYNTNQSSILKLEEENKKYRKNIDELNDIIAKLKIKNEYLIKLNEKLLKEKNTTINLEQNKDNINKYNSPKKSTNQNDDQNGTTNKKNKKMNKTKTNTDLLINGNSLLLLKKIQEENKELSKQLKDFNSKNVQLELSLRGINGSEIKNNNKNHNSLLFNFTKNTRGELKNIEKKYGLAKNNK